MKQPGYPFTPPIGPLVFGVETDYGRKQGSGGGVKWGPPFGHWDPILGIFSRSTPLRFWGYVGSLYFIQNLLILYFILYFYIFIFESSFSTLKGNPLFLQGGGLPLGVWNTIFLGKLEETEIVCSGWVVVKRKLSIESKCLTWISRKTSWNISRTS